MVLRDGAGRVRTPMGEWDIRMKTDLDDFLEAIEASPTPGAGAIVTRHADLKSLAQIDSILPRLRGANGVAPGILLAREEEHNEFKMNCFFCVQKLWVADCDHEKRARCPGCQKAFTLPSHRALLQRQFDLPRDFTLGVLPLGRPVAVMRVLSGLLFEHQPAPFDLERESLRKSTVRIHLPTE